jgi:hypothetical protein
MKRLLTLAVVAISAIAASAQTYGDSALIAQRDSLQNILDKQELQKREKAIWGKGRYTNLGYAITDFAPEGESPTRSKWSFFISKGTTYNFPRHPLAGLVKIGLDVRWFDIQASKLKGFDQSEWSSTIDRTVADPDDDESIELPNIGEYVITAGMGIGPRVTVAPFSSFNNKARYLKASLYFHYRPSYTGYLYCEDGDVEVSHGFYNMFDFGGTINYRFISLGIEGNWGNGKMESISFDSDFSGGDKIKHKIASTRFFLSIAF